MKNNFKKYMLKKKNKQQLEFKNKEKLFKKKKKKELLIKKLEMMLCKEKKMPNNLKNELFRIIIYNYLYFYKF